MRTHSSRSGPVAGMWLAAVASAIVLAGLVAWLAWDPAWFASAKPSEPLLVYCAAGLQAPMEAIAREYEKETGIPVQLQYGGSQTLLTNLEVSQRGDLFLPGDDGYIRIGRDKGLVAESLPLAHMVPVLAVRKGNPLGIHSLADLGKKGARLGMADPDAAAVGKLTRAALQKSGDWSAARAQLTVSKETVNAVANALKVGSIDAGFVWDATVRQYPELEAVPLPQLDGQTAHVAVAVLNQSKQPTAALRFARYLAARDRGLLLFEREGYAPVEGDAWALTPRLRLAAGAMLRPAIDDTIDSFQEREGVVVERVYNGCGILVGNMKAGHRPDVYFACDKQFLTMVKDLFLDGVDVSTNQLVILVPRGNPHKIQTLRDLGKKGLKIGVGHEKQCALGVLTQETLKQTDLHDPIMANVAVQSPAGDMLVNQLRVGSLDAVIAYVSNAAAAGDQLEAIPIDIPCAVAVQPMAASKASNYPQLTRRLMDALRSTSSRERFEANGFHWQGTK